MLPVYDLSKSAGRDEFDARLRRLRQSAELQGQWRDTAAELIDAVRTRGDDAIVDAMRKWTDPGFTADRIRVSPDELDEADRGLDPELRGAIQRSIQHVRAYQQHVMPVAPEPITIDGAELGLRYKPVDSAGLLVPGGSAVLFSTLVMLAVPAQVAGVPEDRLAVVSPPPSRRGDAPAGDISPITLAVCRMLGIERVYRIGGPTAVAALAMGTERVGPVDFVAGPGHPIVQAAKLMLQGVVGVDGFYGASEVVTIADDAADPARVASDLIAQAEHDPGKCFLVAWSSSVIDAVRDQVQRQIGSRRRRAAIEAALRDESCAVLCESEDQAVETADRLASEHVNLAVRDPDSLLEKLSHGGEFFLGDATPVAAGDYYAGPSHCLPTGTTARFSSGVSVMTFLKRSGTVAYRGGMPTQAVADVALMAEAEGLDGHAASARARAGSSEPETGNANA